MKILLGNIEINDRLVVMIEKPELVSWTRHTQPVEDKVIADIMAKEKCFSSRWWPKMDEWHYNKKNDCPTSL